MRDFVKEYPIPSIKREKQSQVSGKVHTYQIKPEEAAAYFEKIGATGYEGDQKQPLKFNRGNAWDGFS